MSICKSAEEYAEKHIKDGVFEDDGWCPDSYGVFNRAVPLAGQSFGCKVYVGWRKLLGPQKRQQGRNRMSTPGQEIKKLERWVAGLSWVSAGLAVAFLLAFAAAIYVRSDQLDTRRFNDKLLDTLIEQDNLIVKQARELRLRPTVVVHRNAKP